MADGGCLRSTVFPQVDNFTIPPINHLMSIYYELTSFKV